MLRDKEITRSLEDQKVPCGSEVVVAEGGTGHLLPRFRLESLAAGTCNPLAAFLPAASQLLFDIRCRSFLSDLAGPRVELLQNLLATARRHSTLNWI